MQHRQARYTRSIPGSRSGRAAVASAAPPDRRRATCLAGCVAACVSALAVLAMPSSAHAGWPLESVARCALAFGESYATTDGGSATHRGVDLAAEPGAVVCAPVGGRVSFAGRVPGPDGGVVLAVTIVSEGRSLTLMPLSSADVRAGAQLAEGETVGRLAESGDASSPGPHLHVGARRNDLYVDPMTVIAAPEAGGASAPQPGQSLPVAETKPHSVPVGSAAGVAAAGVPHGAGSPAAAVAPPATAPLGAGAVAVGVPAELAPGASVAPGVSVAGAVEAAATQGSTMQAVSQALSSAVGGAKGTRSGEGVPGGAVVEWMLGLAARGLQTGARVLAGVLLALGALWPIWRSERRKGVGQLSVRPEDDDVAAVAGQW